MRRRVAITGIGLVCPFGRDLDEVWPPLMAGRSAVAPLSLSSVATGHTLTIPAATVPESALGSVPRAIAGLTDKFARFAVIAAGRAVADAGLKWDAEDRARCGVATGCCMNGITEEEVGFATLFVRHKPKVHPFTLVRTMPNAPAAYIALVHGLDGPALHYSTTCSSSTLAIGEAARQIRHGYADVMVAGGTETLLTYSAVNCWSSSALLAPLADDPARSCRPFDVTRAGAVLSEGAVFVVLEAWEHANARGANVQAELAGYACTADSAHVTQPSLRGQARPMRQALADAEMTPSQIGYVNAHGTGTKANDACESAAIREVFGGHADRLAISSSKGAVGHMIGASGAFGAAVCVAALAKREVPPTANLHSPDPSCDLDYVPNAGRAAPGLSATMCNAFGFGGTAASLVIRAA